MSNEGFKNEVKTEAVILAGGKGTRMRGDAPKPMEEVGGKPMLAYGLDVLEKLNFDERNIVCLVGHKGEVIKSYLGENVKFAEHKNFTGNMGAVLDSLNAVGNKTTDMLVIQGDDCVFLDEKELRKMLEEYERLRPDISIMLTKHTDRNRTRFVLNASKKVVEIKRQKEGDNTAGLFVNGVFIFSVPIIKEYLEKIRDKNIEEVDKEKELGIMDFIVKEFKNGKDIRGFESKQPWMEVNTREQLEKVRNLKSKK